jgi:hypothetical protein
VFGIDPNDPQGEHGTARVLAHAKSNVGRLQRSRQVALLPHMIDVDGEQPINTVVAVIGDECDVSADDLVQVGSRKESPKEQAIRFLRGLLADGPHRSAEVYSLAEDEGISERTLKRAKADLGVKAYQRDREWWWELPADDSGEPNEPEGLR